MSKQKLKFLIILNITWSLLGFYADSNWFSQIPAYLIPLTAICSLYPPLLLIWYCLKYFNRPIPAWYTFWVILGAASYGVIAQFYFPLLMSWQGINFHDVGSMFWVAVYGGQAFILLPHLKIKSLYSLLPGIFYLLLADFTHYFALTFVDFSLPGYPLWMKYLTGLGAVFIQAICAILICRHVQSRQKQLALQEAIN